MSHAAIQDSLSAQDRPEIGRRVLELGCATGVGSALLRSSGALAVVASDIDLSALGLADSAIPPDGRDIALVCLDAEYIPFADHSFDVIVAIELIEHLLCPQSFLAECRRVLGDEGLLILSTPNKAVSSPNTHRVSFPSHTREFYPEELQTMLALHFREVSLFGYYPFTLSRRILETMIALIEPLLSQAHLRGCAVSLANRLFYSSALSAEDANAGPRYEAQPFDQKDRPYTLLAVGRVGRNCGQT